MSDVKVIIACAILSAFGAGLSKIPLAERRKLALGLLLFVVGLVLVLLIGAVIWYSREVRILAAILFFGWCLHDLIKNAVRAGVRAARLGH